MPYPSTADLPSNVRDVLPAHAQEIYRAAFNNAWDEYADPAHRRGDESQEETAHRVAWSAVERQYAKDQQSGAWRRRAS